MNNYVEGLDYYIEEGKWVFTAHFLFKRGYCCHSNCRHCPYVKPGKYIWQNKQSDLPVNVLKTIGVGQDGRIYVKIEGTNTAIPYDELLK